MRFLITIDPSWELTITCPSKGIAWRYTRTMRKISDDGVTAYPAPPLEEADTCGCPLCGGNLAIIREAHKKIYDRRPAVDGVKQFGHYLFEVLIGEELWRIIKETAELENEPIIELALSWPSSEKNLPRLNWEMMRSANNFLAAGSGKTAVAITRVIADAKSSVRQMSLPPRIIFVIGTKITDPVIKPGAEYLGLLSRLKSRGIGSIYSRVLENASPSRIVEVINNFKPDVVHFICHGGIYGGRGYLELQTDEEESDQRRYGNQLAALLRLEDGSYPPVVVLSACDSGSTPTQPGRLLGAHETAPLAVELIQGGVPIVLGMAGKVSDLACRLFTRQFGMALVEGKSLVTSTAEARMATFAQGISPDTSVDWAFPAVFMAKDIDPQYAPVREGEVDPSAQIEGWIKEYNVQNNPVFCGRIGFFQSYYDFFNPGGHQVLAIDVREDLGRLGKTRLLQELTIQALRDGHIPCPLIASNSGWTAPVNAIELGTQIFLAISKVYRIFSLDPPLDSQMLLLNTLSIESLKYSDDLDKAIKIELMLKKTITDHVVHLALQKDLIRLANDVRKNIPLLASGRVLVLLDAVDRYDKAIDSLFQEMLGPSGLGTADEPIPVVLAFSSYGPAQGKFKEYTENVQNSVWLRRTPLNPFEKNGEDMLAYGTILLYPFRPGSVPLVINESNESALKYCQDVVQIWLKGIPEKFAQSDFDDLAQVALRGEFLKEAKDEVIMGDLERMRMKSV